MKHFPWKTIFFITLAAFLLLTISLVVLAFLKASQTTIVGAAGYSTFGFHLTLLLRAPIGYAHTAALILSIVSFIGWRVCKE